MSIDVNITGGDQIDVSIDGDSVSASVPSATGVVSLNGLAGAVSLAFVGGTVAYSGNTITVTITGGGGGAVSSVAGRTGAVVLTHADLTDWDSAVNATQLSSGDGTITDVVGRLARDIDALHDVSPTAWTPNTIYSQPLTGTHPWGLVEVNGVVWQLHTPHTSGATFDATEQAYWRRHTALVPPTHTHVVGDVSGAVATTDSRLSDAREWTAATVTQAQAEAGTDTYRLAWSVLRVWQAIAAWWASSSAKTKLDGMQAGATANQTDAYLLSRANHTGTQAYTTITGLGTLATQSGTFSGTSSGTNTGDQTITLTGDVTGSGTGSFAATLAATTVTAGSYGSASSVATFTVDAKGRLTAAGSTAIAIAAGAVSGLAAVATSGSASDLSTGTVAIARIPTGTTSSTVCIGNDSRLSDARTPLSHTHGNITNAGAIGTTSGLIVVTTAGGVLTTASTISASTQVSGLAAVATSGSASDLTSGTVAAARLGSGTPSASNYLRGDGTWATVSGESFHPFLLAGM